ncbi:hypothetical protein KCU99_g394, partial [Aureobasidium melanogenum]
MNYASISEAYQPGDPSSQADMARICKCRISAAYDVKGSSKNLKHRHWLLCIVVANDMYNPRSQCEVFAAID